MEPAPTAAAANEDDDEWELFNDDGFVYKLRKRRAVDPPQPEPSPEKDPEVDKRRRVERREKMLLKLKSEYEREIGYWENLSNSARAMEVEAREARAEEATTSFLCVEDSGCETDRNSGGVLDEFETEVAAKEVILHEMSHLCDTVDAICDAREEAFKKSMFDLPIWDSPRRLMKSLCDGDE